MFTNDVWSVFALKYVENKTYQDTLFGPDQPLCTGSNIEAPYFF